MLYGTKFRKRILPIALTASLVALTGCPTNTPATDSPEMTKREMVTWLKSELSRVDFATEVKQFAGAEGFNYFILERPAYDGEAVMRFAVLYREPSGPADTELLRPVGIVPGFSAGGFFYLQYTRALVEQGYIVFLSDVKGDYIHFIGLELFADPFIDPDILGLLECAGELKEALQEYTGDESLTLLNVFLRYKTLYNGAVEDQEMADLYREHLFAYRGYSLNLLVTAMFEVNEDPASPVHGRVDTERIGLEAHSLGPDDVVNALVKRDGQPTYWWSENVKVALLKGGVLCLHGTDNFRTIDTPVYFMNGEYDSDLGILQATWKRFHALNAPGAYVTFKGSGHLLFVDPPVGYLGDKLLPYFGSYRGVTLPAFRRNRVDMSALSVLIYDAYLKEDPEALQALSTGAVEVKGEYSTRNL